MTPAQFQAALAATQMHEDGATTRAARLVLVDGVSRRRAAAAAGIDLSALKRALQRLDPKSPCPHCAGTGYVAAS